MQWRRTSWMLEVKWKGFAGGCRGFVRCSSCGILLVVLEDLLMPLFSETLKRNSSFLGRQSTQPPLPILPDGRSTCFRCIDDSHSSYLAYMRRRNEQQRGSDRICPPS
ncbi:hypothetical protein SCHPADRAFT_898472 [Schizopora paradoxa]|uniref:Uncharacterized protein n=1 Tax=Schizopora paradoxa TaxID=27342 RepID=A0A0H2S6S7_9AGAM|nr:hypothetical protein SCHPADRAFT_898472 [Schizopora paradoxa]